MRTFSANSPVEDGSTARSADCVQLNLNISEASSSVCASLSPVAGRAVDRGAEASSQQPADAAAASPAAADLGDDESEAAEDAEAHSCQSAVSADEVPKTHAKLVSQIDGDSAEELQKLLVEEKQKTAALIGNTECTQCSHCKSLVMVLKVMTHLTSVWQGVVSNILFICN